jgi:hypothetical protein
MQTGGGGPPFSKQQFQACDRLTSSWASDSYLRTMACPAALRWCCRAPSTAAAAAAAAAAAGPGQQAD